LTFYECPSSLAATVVRGSTLTGASSLLDTEERGTIFINEELYTEKDEANQADVEFTRRQTESMQVVIDV